MNPKLSQSIFENLALAVYILLASYLIGIIMDKVEHTINLTSPTVNYRVSIYSLEGELMMSGVTTDKEKSIHVVDSLNHTKGSKLRGTIQVEASSANAIHTPIPL